MKSIIFLGSGGHFKVACSAFMNSSLKDDYTLLGVTGPESNIHGDTKAFLRRAGLEYLGDDSVIRSYAKDQILLVNCLGTADYRGGVFKDNTPLRKRLFNEMKASGYSFISLSHSFSFIDDSALLGEGCQIMAGSVIQPSCVIKENAIINTSASIDHDSSVGSHTHIAPGAVLCGGVTIGNCVLVGAGARVLPGIAIGDHAVVGAGAVVTQNVDNGAVVMGVPARQLV